MIQMQDRGNVAVVHIRTPSIDAVSAREIEEFCGRSRKITVLDFEQVAFINSAGISGLLKFIVAARKRGHRVYAIHVSKHHRKIFKMVELSRFMPIIEEHEIDQLE
ncbi:MAG: STAS domain-containing protein [Chloroflexia bacterium]|nr:STAS domain-containing protein [Chloroflexia bacterium]